MLRDDSAPFGGSDSRIADAIRTDAARRVSLRLSKRSGDPLREDDAIAGMPGVNITL